jgi:hypothetical protein
MELVRPIRGPQGQFRSNSFRLCRYAPPASNPRTFCRCETASHLFIAQPLERACLHGFARKYRLTPVFSADPQMGGGDLPPRQSLSPWSTVSTCQLPAVDCCLSSHLSTAPRSNTQCFQSIAHSPAFPENPTPAFSSDYTLRGEGAIFSRILRRLDLPLPVNLLLSSVCAMPTPATPLSSVVCAIPPGRGLRHMRCVTTPGLAAAVDCGVSRRLGTPQPELL